MVGTSRGTGSPTHVHLPSTPAGFPPVYPSHVVDGGGGTLVSIPPMVNDGDPITQHSLLPTREQERMNYLPKKMKDGGLRFCVDYRKVNAATKLDEFPLPRIDDTLDLLAGSRYFTTLDLASGYWHVPIDPASPIKKSMG